MPRQVDAGGVEWTDPPGRTRYDWDIIAEQLENKPMVWGLVFQEDRTSVANAVRQGAVARVKPIYGFETRTANNVPGPPRTCSFWLRYNPERDVRKA